QAPAGEADGGWVQIQAGQLHDLVAPLRGRAGGGKQQLAVAAGGVENPEFPPRRKARGASAGEDPGQLRWSVMPSVALLGCGVGHQSPRAMRVTEPGGPWC